MAVDGAGVWHKSFEFTLPAPLEKVWALTHDFIGINNWAPSVVGKSTCVEGEPQKPGCVRRVEPPLPRGMPEDSEDRPYVTERLLEMDPGHHMYKYCIEKTNIPELSVLEAGYVSTFQFADAGNNSTLLVWSYEAAPVSQVTEEAYQAIVTYLYENCVAELKKQL